MAYPKDILNKIKWTPPYNLKLAGVMVIYTDRKTKTGQNCFFGEDVLSLGASFITFQPHDDNSEPTTMPYHRIERIELGGEKVWDAKDYSGWCETRERE
jgi:uncharacterized protein (UPF0248 family)